MGVESNLYPNVAGAFIQAEAAFPESLARDFARILQRIELLWGNSEAVTYLDSLILGDGSDNPGSPRRTDRQGFPAAVLEDIVLLKQVHEFLFPSLNISPYDPFSGLEGKMYDKKPGGSSGMLDFESTSAQAAYGGAKEPARQRIDWPVSRTQREMAESAELLRSGASIYEQQGKRIGEILVHYDVTDERTIRIVLRMQERPEHKGQAIGRILIEIGIIRQEDLNRALCIQSGVMMVDVLEIQIPYEISRTIPITKASEKQVIPVCICHSQLFLAVADPFSFGDSAFFAALTGFKVIPVFAPRNEIVNRLKMHGLSMPTSTSS